MNIIEQLNYDLQMEFGNMVGLKIDDSMRHRLYQLVARYRCKLQSCGLFDLYDIELITDNYNGYAIYFIERGKINFINCEYKIDIDKFK